MEESTKQQIVLHTWFLLMFADGDGASSHNAEIGMWLFQMVA